MNDLLEKKAVLDKHSRYVLSQETRKLSNLIVEACEDYVARVRIYSAADDSVWMRAIVSDEEGTQMLVQFRLERDGSRLSISENFASVGGLAKRRLVFEKLRKGIVAYLDAISSLVGFGLSAVTFDTEGTFRNCFYIPSKSEAGCVDLFLLYYKKTDCSLADIPSAGSEMIDIE